MEQKQTEPPTKESKIDKSELVPGKRPKRYKSSKDNEIVKPGTFDFNGKGAEKTQ
jgi:hypothetical protein